jgi:hypothetical protein
MLGLAGDESNRRASYFRETRHVAKATVYAGTIVLGSGAWFHLDHHARG